MTSNIGARLITEQKHLGFTSNNLEEKEESKKEYENTKKEVLAELKKQFKPEFINRIDEIIVFHKLQNDDIKQIIDIMIKDLEKRLEKQNIKIEIEESVKEKILKEGSNNMYGARPLRRALETLVEDKITEAILDGKLTKNKTAKIALNEDGEIIVD
jgi:ATP-dependent Clp protease ATP-binding subunit ClpC